MTGTVCCADLITGSEFVVLIDLWQKEGRPPFVLGDWLRDRDLWRQGAVVDWCVAQPLRRNFNDGSLMTGPMPLHYKKQGYMWMPSVVADGYADELLQDRGSTVYRKFEYGTAPTFIESIVMLLDYYTPPAE